MKIRIGSKKYNKQPRDSFSEKENQPPQKNKGKVSVAGLFSKKHQQASKPKGVSKQTPPKARTSVRLKQSKKAAEHPLFRKFSEATKLYKQIAKETGVQSLEAAYQDLIERVDKATVDEDGLKEAGISKSGSDKQAHETQALLLKPLEDELIQIRGRDQKPFEVTLGGTLRAFKKLLQKKRSELGPLIDGLREVEEEIAATKSSILKMEKKARRQRDEVVQSLVQEVQDAQDQTMAEITEARKDEKEAAVEERRKLNEFMKQLP